MMAKAEVHLLGKYAGTLSSSTGGELSFSYAAGYAGPPLSVAMPLFDGVYQGRRVWPWFDNLLPDNHLVRAGMARAAGIPRGTFSLLCRYGLDLPGAVQVVAQENRAEFEARRERYRVVSEREVGARLREMVQSERDSRASSWTTAREHWSLGGNQGKLALRRFGGQWFSCEGSAASNAIVKPGVSSLQSQALDECVTMRLVQRCGLPCAPVWMERFGDEQAIVIERYDRIARDDGVVRRIHQEDLCQAFGVSSEKKYAQDGGPSAPPIMRLLAEVDPDSRYRFYDALLFNHFTASTDAHAKNYSLLHFSDGSTTLAPLYDIASLAPYMKPRRAPYKLAMGIGGETRVGALRKTSIQRFARTSGLEERELFDRAYRLIARIREQLPRVFEEPDLAQVAGIDELASRFIPRIRMLCNYSERNLSRTGNQVAIPDIAKVKPLQG